MKELYFDNNASTKPSKQVRQALWEQRELFGNPSSSYRMGRVAKEQVELARQNVASLLNAEPENIFFTSGGTESNNLALKGYLNSLHRHAGQLITSSIEHPSVLEVMEYYRAKFGYQVEHLPVDREGIVMPEALKARLGRNTKMISIMTANNETGSIQPISEFCGLAQERGIFFHTDAVQAVGKIEIDVKALGVDALSLSGHKLNAPKGIGALYLKTPEKLTPLLHGGKQEKGLRCGTENLMGIIGLGSGDGEAIARNHDKTAVLFIDLDHFKQVNDQYGHRIGDLLLKNVAEKLLSGVRKEDVVARLGGDEFVIILQQVHALDDIRAIADKLLSMMQKPIVIEGHHCVIGLSIGISRFPENEQTAEGLLKSADAAMYLSKKTGRNRITISQIFSS